MNGICNTTLSTKGRRQRKKGYDSVFKQGVHNVPQCLHQACEAGEHLQRVSEIVLRQARRWCPAEVLPN